MVPKGRGRPGRHVRPALALLLLAVFLAAGATGLFLAGRPPAAPQQGPGGQAAQQPAELRVPLVVGDYLSLYIVDSQVLQNGSLLPFYVSKGLYEVVNISFPFITLSGPNGTLTLPLYYIWVPPGAQNISTPIESVGVPGYMCMTLYRYGGYYFYGSEPGNCTEATASIEFDPRTGFTYQTELFIAAPSGPIREDIFLTSYSVNPNASTLIELNSSDELCNGPYSQDVVYTTPGGYYINGTTVEYLPYLSLIGNRTPLLVLYAGPSVQPIWSLLPGRYSGYVIVVSPIMHDIQDVPFLSDALAYGAVYEPAPGEVVVGVDNVLRNLTGAQH